jgi:sterol 3beta-glucosyltransferase
MFESFVREHGLGFAQLAGDPAAIVASADHWLETGRRRDAIPGVRRFARMHGALLDALLLDYWRTVQGSDLVIYSAVAFAACSVAERLGIPGISACLQPLHRTREFPVIALGDAWNRSARFNLATYAAMARLAWYAERRRINRWRREVLELPPIPSGRVLGEPGSAEAPVATIYGYSPSVLATPVDWPQDVHVTGYWILLPRSNWQPPAELTRFLDAGPPPVYIGFGSMTPQHAGALTSLAVDAVSRTGNRGILLSGWGELGAGPLPESVLAVRDVPHEWLFPRMRAIVHHGGAGTTGAALRSGRPSVVIPLGFDQPFWGRRSRALGVAPAPIPRRQLTADRLTAAIERATTDTVIGDRARHLGETLCAEHGVDQAVAVIERVGRVGPAAPR